MWCLDSNSSLGTVLWCGKILPICSLHVFDGERPCLKRESNIRPSMRQQGYPLSHHASSERRYCTSKAKIKPKKLFRCMLCRNFPAKIPWLHRKWWAVFPAAVSLDLVDFSPPPQSDELQEKKTVTGKCSKKIPRQWVSFTKDRAKTNLSGIFIS